MNVAIISKYGSVPGSGTLTRLFYISKYLQSEKYNVEYIISDSNHLGKGLDREKVKNVEIATGVKVKILKLLKYSNQGSIGRLISWFQFELKLIWYLFFNKKELLIVSSPSIFTILTGVLFKRLHKSKLVVDIRDIWPMTLIEEGGVSAKHPLMWLMFKIQNIGYVKSDLVMSSIPNLSSHILEVTGKHNKFFCLPMGYDSEDDKLASPDDSLRKSMGVDSDKTVVGYIGSMGPTNNLDTFVELIKMTKSSNLHYLLVGDGSLYEKFKSELNGISNVTFTGRVTKDEARKYTQICDLVYFSTHKSSIWKYGQSLNKVLDYMLIGKPIVAAYPDFGFKSMINEANCGYFIESDNLDEHIQTFNNIGKKSQGSLKAMGESGQEWVLEHRNYETLVNELKKVLKDV